MPSLYSLELFEPDSSPLVWAEMKGLSGYPGSPTAIAVFLLQLAVGLPTLNQDACPAQVLHPANKHPRIKPFNGQTNPEAEAEMIGPSRPAPLSVQRSRLADMAT